MPRSTISETKTRTQILIVGGSTMTTNPTKKPATLTASAFLAASIAAVSGLAGATELSLYQLDAKSLDGGYMLFAKALTNVGKCGES